MTDLERVIKTFNEGQKKILFSINASESLDLHRNGGYTIRIGVSITDFIFDYGLCEVLWGDIIGDCEICPYKSVDSCFKFECQSSSNRHKEKLSTLPPSDRLKYIIDNSEV